MLPKNLNKPMIKLDASASKTSETSFWVHLHQTKMFILCRLIARFLIERFISTIRLKITMRFNFSSILKVFSTVLHSTSVQCKWEIICNEFYEHNVIIVQIGSASIATTLDDSVHMKFTHRNSRAINHKSQNFCKLLLNRSCLFYSYLLFWGIFSCLLS